MSITRRDFLNGAALTIAAGLTPATQLAAQPARYPPALMGLRGQHEGSFEAAHALAREGRKFPVDGLPISETYDLVVVGGGISGLSAAWFYRRAKPSARILILDNHDDFGGHAKRNEFTLDGRRIVGYGGSQSLQSPKSLYSPVAKGLLRDLGVDVTRFETAFERGLYPSLGLSRGTFFNREMFGRDVLVTGDPGSDEDNARPNAKPLSEFVSAFPIAEASKAQIVALYSAARDPLAGVTNLDLSAEAFPYLGVREAEIAGVPARLLRAGFVGELGYEIHVPADRACALWDALMEAGSVHGIRPFGVEAQRLLRLEKGHIIIGQDTDGLTTPGEAAVDWAVKMDKPYFVGQRSLEIVQRKNPKATLVGFTLDSTNEGAVPKECHLVIRDGKIAGRVTSIAWSPALEKHVGLAFVSREIIANRGGFFIRVDDGRMVPARIAKTPFYDAAGDRQKFAA